MLTANVGALRELRTWRGEFAEAESLVRAAPHQRVLEAHVSCESVADAQRMLRNEGAFAPLRLRKLAVAFDMRTDAAVLSRTLPRTPAWTPCASLAHRWTRPLR